MWTSSSLPHGNSQDRLEQLCKEDPPPPLPNYPMPNWYPQQPLSGVNTIKMRDPPAVPV